MNEFTCIKGSEMEGILIAGITDGIKFVIHRTTLILYGLHQSIEFTNSSIVDKLKAYALAEFKKKQKYKRMEELMLKNLSESVVIENERAFEQCLWEYKQKLEGDERMLDLNGDLKAF